MSRHKLILVCANCGIDFGVKPSRAKRCNVQFCSRQCRWPSADKPLEVRFRQHLSPPNEHGCVLWAGTQRSNGYGAIYDGRKPGCTSPTFLQAHRVSWEISRGPIPDGLEVMHDCDQFYPVGDITYRLCVNLSHLLLGTHKDNMADMAAKDRNSNNRGEGNNLSKLLGYQVRAIRRLYASGDWTMERLAVRFDTTIGNIHAIVHRRSWDHLR